MWPATAAMACATAVVALAVVSFDGTLPAVYPVRFQIAAPPQTTFGRYFVVSPDGRHVAFHARRSCGPSNHLDPLARIRCVAPAVS